MTPLQASRIAHRSHDDGARNDGNPMAVVAWVLLVDVIALIIGFAVMASR